MNDPTCRREDVKRHLKHGQTVIYSRVAMVDGVRKFVPQDDAVELIKEGLARPERLYIPPGMRADEPK